MRKRMWVSVLAVVMFVGCTAPEKTARDSIAGAAGVLKVAQAKYADQCKVAPSGTPCVAINKAIAAQNLAIEALETYCALGPTAQLTDKCQPVKAAEPALQSAIANLNQVISDVQGLVKK